MEDIRRNPDGNHKEGAQMEDIRRIPRIKDNKIISLEEVI